jgi:hypothetical protein
VSGKSASMSRNWIDPLRMRECWLGHRHEAVPALATGRSQGGDPSETTFREVVWQPLFPSKNSLMSFDKLW